METLVLILAGGKGSRLDILSQKRSKPAMPFAGKYRIIDFSLSNCVQSGLFNVAILTQYLPLSLNEHIGNGKPWDLDRRDASLTLLQPHSYWYLGTADAVLKNLEFIERKNPKNVLILSGDHIYKMDYRKMIQKHNDKSALLTIAVQPVPMEEASRFGIVEVNKDDEITGFIEKPANPPSNLASMGIYVFDFSLLQDVLRTTDNQELDFGKDIIPKLIETTKKSVYSYEFDGYWKDVGTYESYLEANLEMTKDYTPLNLHDPSWKVYTRSEEYPPVKISANAKVEESLVSNGCVIEGTVINSVLSPGVRVGKNTIIKNSVILNDSIIGDNVIIDNSILDKKVVVGRNTIIGYGDDYTPNIEEPTFLTSGISVVEKSTIIPGDMKIGRNVRIFKHAEFPSNEIKSGSTLK